MPVRQVDQGNLAETWLRPEAGLGKNDRLDRLDRLVQVHGADQLREDQGEYGATARVAADFDFAPVRFHGFADDSKAEPGAPSPAVPAPPETIEYALSIFGSYAGTAVGNADASARMNTDHDLGVLWGMGNGVLHEIAERILERVGIALDEDRLFRLLQGERSDRSGWSAGRSLGGLALRRQGGHAPWHRS